MTTQATGLTVRPFNNDYDALARLQNAVFTEFQATPDELRFDDEHRPERCRHQRWVALREGRIVGIGQYDQNGFIYDPRKFSVDVTVDPEALLQGIGSTLFRTVIEALQPLQPTTVDAWTREDMHCRVSFLTRRGFAENMRMWASELDLATFDPTPFAGHIQKVEAQGVEIRSLADLAGDPELPQKVFELWNEVRHDVPIPPGEVRQDMPYSEWLEQWERPSKLPDGYFMAIADGQFVGTSQLWKSPEDDLLKTGLTGVRRAYRRRGIALALKLRAIEYARHHGYRRIVTDNESGNRPMLAINERLGFWKHPAWVRYVGDWSAVSQRTRSAGNNH